MDWMSFFWGALTVLAIEAGLISMLYFLFKTVSFH